MIRSGFAFSFVLTLLFSCSQPTDVPEVEQWGVFELVLNGPSDINPYMEVEHSAVFSSGESSIKVPGFYDGDGSYRIRFSPPSQGDWTWLTSSNTPELSGWEGTFRCLPPGENNHGPLEVVNTCYLQYVDGTSFYGVGTTAYQWTSVDQKIQEKTLETLADAPFNKIRMCVFPKKYRFGNNTEPWMHPFEGKDTLRDFSKPNFAFFQNFDRRVKQLMELGIQADVILFHPYDAWGYCEMGKEMNERYTRYMMARLSAFRNVWWSLANEWDIPSIRDSIDWEGIGTLLQNEDPHPHLRGIHNWYGSEDHFYDHSRPWITHVCTQTSQFYNAEKWRKQYQKPLLFDEMRYEGDVSAGWGNLSGEEMSSYFWMAGLSGGYPTHGDTHRNAADDSTEVRWWAKGGELVGSSPERIAYFRSIMEQAPVTEMIPELKDNGDPKNLESNVHLFYKPGEYYLAYVAESDRTIEITLPGNQGYQKELIDTWNMEPIHKSTVEAGTFTFTTEFPYTLVRITRP